MAKRKRMNKNVVLTEAEITILMQTMTPVHKNEVTVVKGSQQGVMASVRNPAYARLPLHTVARICLLARQRNLDTEYPEAMRFHKTGLTGVFTAEPVAKYDENQTDLYELKWTDDRKMAHMDLLPILQPRNMQVAPGFVLDVPLSTRAIGKAEYLIFHFDQAEIRPEEEGTPRNRDKNKDPNAKKEDAVKKDEPAKKEEGANVDPQPQAQRETAAGTESQAK